MTVQLLLEQLQTVTGNAKHIGAAGLFAFAVYMVTFFVRKQKGDTTGNKEIFFGVLLAAATGLVLGMTLFSREYNPFSRNFELELFWSYKLAFLEHDRGLELEIYCNILLFIPWGFLLPTVWKRFEDGRWMLSAALMLSGGVELCQGILRLGLFEFDDIFNNTLGALIGFVLYWLVKCLCRKIRMILKKRT